MAGSAWQVNAILSSLVIAGQQAALLIYSPEPGPGNLVGSWASEEFTDAYGNTVPAGINATQGTLTSVALNDSTILNAVIDASTINNANINNPGITGGTIIEASITFDTTGGNLLVYTSTTTTVTFNTAGHTTFTSPVSGPADIRVWGADAGAGGGSGARGGEGGGGGEFAREPNYQLAAGQVYTVDVGAGGIGGNTGKGGSSGGDSGFDNLTVIAGGGKAGSNFIGGQGGNKSTNTIHFKGGNGGGNGSQSTGGCGGGGRAGLTGPGGNGATSGGSSGASGGSAGSGAGGIAGAAGGANAANGNNGPAGGSGCGAATSATTGTSTYFHNTSTYYGSDASGGNANGKRVNVGSPFYQGGETASGGTFNGTQKTLAVINGNPGSDLAGKTIDRVTLKITNQHSWFNNGMYLLLGYNNRSSTPNTWDASDVTSVQNLWISQGNTYTYDMSNTNLPAALQNGSARSLTFGPGPSYNLNNYGFCAGTNSGNGPQLDIDWHTGSAPVKAGNGGAGVVTVTYTNASALESAISPVAGTDASGNAYAPGYTGPVQAFQPIVTPTAVEVWHNVTPPSGWSGTVRYKKIAENNTAVVDIQCTHAGTTGNITFLTLPVGYRPAVNSVQPLGITSNVVPANDNKRITINSTGPVTTYSLPSPTTGVFGTWVYPLD